MIRLNQLKIPALDVNPENTSEISLLKRCAAKILKCGANDIRKLKIVKRSVDARNKDNILFVYTIDVKLRDSLTGPSAATEAAYLSSLHIARVAQAPVDFFHIDKAPRKAVEAIGRPVIIGAGPCGLLAAYTFIESGLKPVILERGSDVRSRIARTEDFFRTGHLDTECNIQFGEGGAGTFSDGKLSSGIRDREGIIEFILRTFIRFGADDNILYEQKPHVGTDSLIGIIANLREYIVANGGKYIFNARFDGIKSDCGILKGIRYTDLTSGDIIFMDASCAILAPGHSARDTFEYLCGFGISMKAKPFAAGIRIQHPQELIDRALYGERKLKEKQRLLGPASYKLTYRASNGRNVYSFCMCPGGYVINASSEKDSLTLNGMSYNMRASGAANSAIVVNVSPEDLDVAGGSPLGGVKFQRALEKAAFRLAGGSIPYESFPEFRDAVPVPEGISDFPIMGKGSFTPADVRSILPEFMSIALTEGIEAFDKRIGGFAGRNALIFGVETRTSSPVTILRDSRGFSPDLKGLSPAGEGAGYAGGIISAAADGIRTALKAIENAC